MYIIQFHILQVWTDEGGVLLRSLLDHSQIVATGECELSSTNKQLEAFESQVSDGLSH